MLCEGDAHQIVFFQPARGASRGEGQTFGSRCLTLPVKAAPSSYTVTATDRMDYDESFGKRNELL